jgi:hypothetical protein
MKNYYSAPKGFLLDPFSVLYQASDYEVSQDDAIQELIQYGLDLAPVWQKPSTIGEALVSG